MVTFLTFLLAPPQSALTKNWASDTACIGEDLDAERALRRTGSGRCQGGLLTAATFFGGKR